MHRTSFLSGLTCRMSYILSIICLLAVFGLGCQCTSSCGRDGLCCNADESCCPLKNGTFGCFPESNAVCCDESSFACKNGYVCHMQYSMCIDEDMVIPPMSPNRIASACSNEPLKAIKKDIEILLQSIPRLDRQCGGPNAFCSDNYTCCAQAKPTPACCPLLNGACCADGLHCCPSGYTCGATGCVGASKSFNRVSERFNRPINVNPAATVFCPDHTVCFDNQTCCKLDSGRFGCCPDEKAVCCADGKHCCPHDTQCDVVHQKCVKKVDFVTLIDTKSKKVDETPSFLMKSKFSGSQVVCPDPQYNCPDNTTCCHLKSGVYGCCPYPNAVCCADQDNCCPNGYTCDSVHQRCVSSPSPPELRNVIRPLRQKLFVAHDDEARVNFFNSAARVARVGEVICPDKSSVCEDGTTCCQMADGTYGCCPYVNATCCADHQHCCPQGYTCDLVHQQCAKSTTRVQAPLSFILIETIITDDQSEQQVSEVDEAHDSPTQLLFEEFMAIMGKLMSSERKVAEKEDKAPHEMKPSCSVLDTLMLGCPQGTACCRPIGQNLSPVCCPGSSQVSCCPAGCCPENHECNPLTLTCQPTTGHTDSLGFIENA